MKYCKIVTILPECVVPLLFLAACAALPGGAARSPVYITDRARYGLLPPAEIERPIDCAQRLSGTWGADEFVMAAWVKADSSGIDMELYNDFGASMGSFSFNGKGASFDSPVFPRSFKAEYLAADFQFCFYRAAAVAAALKKCGLVFEQSQQARDGGSVEIRRIIDGDNLIVEIVKKETEIQYSNFLRGYSFSISIWEAE